MGQASWNTTRRWAVYRIDERYTPDVYSGAGRTRHRLEYVDEFDSEEDALRFIDTQQRWDSFTILSIYVRRDM
jgi:hypothetical protein